MATSRLPSSFSRIVRTSLSSNRFHSIFTKTTPETVTHTGQAFDKDDYRQLRFEDNPKHVNTKWAIDLIKEVAPIGVKGRIAYCDGGPNPELGHPGVYINVDQPGSHSCGYCGLRFFKEDAH